MALIIPVGFAQVSWLFSLTDDPEEMVTTCGLNLGAETDLEAVGLDLIQAFQAAFPVTAILSAYSFNGVRLVAGNASGPPTIVEVPVVHQGTASSGGPLPQNCAFLVKKQSAEGGRTNRGRQYWPPFMIVESAVTATGTMSPTDTAIVQGRFNTVYNPNEWVILHDDTSPGDGEPTAITSFVLDRQIATQRRRLR